MLEKKSHEQILMAFYMKVHSRLFLYFVSASRTLSMAIRVSYPVLTTR